MAKSTVSLMEAQLMSPPAVPIWKNTSVAQEFRFHCLNFKISQPVVVGVFLQTCFSFFLGLVFFGFDFVFLMNLFSVLCCF